MDRSTSQGPKIPTIVYTEVDEAPALATYALLPIIRAFTSAVGVAVETRDISLAGRILSAFPEWLTEDQRVPDDLAYLGQLVENPGAVIVKLPNISASVPQLKHAVRELRGLGLMVPEFPDEPRDEGAREIRERFGGVLGSPVDPVLRRGNSDRCVPAPVKAFARRHPHSMGAWSADSRSHVAYMSGGDWRSNEVSLAVGDGEAGAARVELVGADGAVRALADGITLAVGDVADASVLGVSALRAFLAEQVEDALRRNVLCSLHLEVAIDERPGLAMVDSGRGITGLRVPSDVIVDASLPAAIRESGRMLGRDGALHDTKFVIPDSSYAGVYQAVIDDCKEHGAFDPRTMGSVPNVGLTADGTEEYGSHDTTFVIEAAGTVRVVSQGGAVLLERAVEPGDIWRLCRVSDAAVRDWVRLAVSRARATGAPAVFWLDRDRPHDAELIAKVERYLQEHDNRGLELSVMSPVEATRHTCRRLRAGLDTISVTGNVLRDHLTDLFPILEVGTSARMLSIVPLMAGGALFETGAGGSAPKHVQQFLEEGHLRWDSLGEYLALAAALEHLSGVHDNRTARVLADALDRANARSLEDHRAPSRAVFEIDNRGSSFYLALYWAEEMATQHDDPALAEEFDALADALRAEERVIADELLAAQGSRVDIGGYYRPDPRLAERAMRPSETLNRILQAFTA